jgi:hypothetical protein
MYCNTACALRVAESLAQELELERKSRQQQQQQQQQAERDVKSPLQGKLIMRTGMQRILWEEAMTLGFLEIFIFN